MVSSCRVLQMQGGGHQASSLTAAFRLQGMLLKPESFMGQGMLQFHESAASCFITLSISSLRLCRSNGFTILPQKPYALKWAMTGSVE